MEYPEVVRAAQCGNARVTELMPDIEAAGEADTLLGAGQRFQEESQRSEPARRIVS
jgi:hypothetical protein